MVDLICRAQVKGTANAHGFIDILGAAGDGVNTVRVVTLRDMEKPPKEPTLLCVIELLFAAPMNESTVIFFDEEREWVGSVLRSVDGIGVYGKLA